MKNSEKYFVHLGDIKANEDFVYAHPKTVTCQPVSDNREFVSTGYKK